MQKRYITKQIWVILLQTEHHSDRPIFDLAETFFTGSISKKKRHLFEEFFFF